MKKSQLDRYCHDRDIKASKLVERIIPEWKERNDPNHSRNSFNTLFAKYNYGRKNLLRGLKESLVRWNTLNQKFSNVGDRKNYGKTLLIIFVVIILNAYTKSASKKIELIIGADFQVKNQRML